MRVERIEHIAKQDAPAQAHRPTFGIRQELVLREQLRHFNADDLAIIIIEYTILIICRKHCHDRAEFFIDDYFIRLLQAITIKIYPRECADEFEIILLIFAIGQI